MSAERATRPRPPLFRALGAAEPPHEVVVDSHSYSREELFKHDSWAATALYSGSTGKIVCKFNRIQPVLGLPMMWLGRRLAEREHRAVASRRPAADPDAARIRVCRRQAPPKRGRPVVRGRPPARERRARRPGIFSVSPLRAGGDAPPRHRVCRSPQTREHHRRRRRSAIPRRFPDRLRCHASANPNASRDEGGLRTGSVSAISTISKSTSAARTRSRGNILPPRSPHGYVFIAYSQSHFDSCAADCSSCVASAPAAARSQPRSSPKTPFAANPRKRRDSGPLLSLHSR